ncbi:ABC transporter permease [Planomicrobium sp. CPCC 101110]|uniref:ABC transporter permease n=1 Tax=Planomicrobium sp. CPCC 101110 TaxID=2599619 RepID=UPI0011B48F1B|nr:ABC transporter permease [Planomicrobium sp. CPCC 101110]TWT24773.1 ABC transporter permease subunit [Planomicrobium sp. CPCC 101110]
MNPLMAVLHVEVLKLRKGKLLWAVLAAFTFAPLMGGFFMFVLKNPEFAKTAGLLGAKARIAGEASWPAYFSLLAQIIAVGGLIVFGFVASWIFGREYTDRTIKDLLALPYHRGVLVAAKFLAVMATTGLLSLYVTGLGMVIGWGIGLAGWSQSVLQNGLAAIVITALLTISLSAPVAFFACWGRGYLAPLGFVVLMVVFSQIIAAVGYGAYFPWSIPALYSGVAGEGYDLKAINIFIVLAASLAGGAGTWAWWLYADQY